MRRIGRSRRLDDGERVKFFPRAPLSERLEGYAKNGSLFCCDVIRGDRFYSRLPPPQALRFSRRGERQTPVTREWLVMKHKRPWEGERREAPVFFYPLSFARKFYEADLLKGELCCISNTVDPRRGIGLTKFHSGVIRILNVPREEKHGYCRTLSPFSLPIKWLWVQYAAHGVLRWCHKFVPSSNKCSIVYGNQELLMRHNIQET